MFFLETQNQTEVGFCFSVEPSNDTRQGLEATEKEFLGAEPTNEAIRRRKCSEANETTIKEENITTGENRFVTLTLATSKLVSSTTKLLCVFVLFFHLLWNAI